LQTPKSNQNASPQAYGTSPRLGVPLLRCPSGGIAYGLLRDDLLSMCPAAPYGAARPPPDEHLHSAFRRGGWIKINSGRRANARPVEWWGRVHHFVVVGDVRSSCRACEAAFEDEVLANPGNTVFPNESGVWFYDRCAAERSLAGSTAATGVVLCGISTLYRFLCHSIDEVSGRTCRRFPACCGGVHELVRDGLHR